MFRVSTTPTHALSRRRSQRVLMQVGIRVRGKDAQGKDFEEMTETLAINAHGALIFSIATGLSVRMGQTADTIIAFYGLDRLRFVKPTFIGDTVRVRQKVEGKSERDERSGIVTMLNEVVNQRDEVVVSYTAKVLLKRHP